MPASVNGIVHPVDNDWVNLTGANPGSGDFGALAASAGLAAADAQATADEALSRSGTNALVLTGHNARIATNAADIADLAEVYEGMDPARLAELLNLADLIEGGLDLTDGSMATIVTDSESSTRGTLDTLYPRVDLAPSGNQATDIANLTVAATAAVAAGRRAIRLAPGHYDFAGITPDDIGGCYIAGDGVTVTQGSFIFPFDSVDLARRVGTSGTSGGRGRIAFEVDDALWEHWVHLFPKTKELGITVGTAWHTDNGARWIKEAHRHGWEVIFHMPDNVDTTTLTEAQLVSQIESGLDQIESVIGTRDGLGFVYPMHMRNADTDRVLSRYFTRGRGISLKVSYMRGAAHPWLTTAYNIDGALASGALPETLRDFLQAIAASDSDCVVYFHLNQAELNKLDGLEMFVNYVRSLGIEIVNPNQIWGGRQVVHDPNDTKGEWIVGGGVSRSSERAYIGARSFMHTSPASGHNTGTISAVDGSWVVGKPGMFTLYRLSFRYYATAPITLSSASFGVQPQVSFTTRNVNGTLAYGGSRPVGGYWPQGSATLPAANWERVSIPIYAPPSAVRIVPRLLIANTNPGSVPLYIDDIRLDRLDEVSSVTVSGTLNGTTPVVIPTGIANLADYGVSVVAHNPAGEVKFRVSSDTTSAVVQSTNAADNQKVWVTVHPGPSYTNLDFPTAGA